MWPFHKNNNAATLRSREPYWLLRNGIGAAGSPLGQSIHCDVVIIGAGITGALVADSLIATGLGVTVLDSRDVGQGSTSASTALLQYEIDTSLMELTRLLGAEKAAQAYLACAGSFEVLERRMPELLPLAGYERRESVYVAEDDRAVPELRAELAARRAIGINVQWLDGGELRRRHGCQRPGAILSALGAQVDPLRLARGLLHGCVRHGVKVFARTKVSAIDEVGETFLLRTVGGHTVGARFVVVCAGYESLSFVPPKVAELNNTFALVTEPLNPAELATGMPLIWESARPYLYVRGTDDGRLIVGGEDVPFKSAAAREAMMPRQMRRLEAKYQALFGVNLPQVAYGWAGTFAETGDGLPFIGAIPGANPRLQYALCYGGNGITYSVHAGEIVRAHIEGRSHPLDEVFGFARLPAAALAPSRERHGLGT